MQFWRAPTGQVMILSRRRGYQGWGVQFGTLMQPHQKIKNKSQLTIVACPARFQNTIALALLKTTCPQILLSAFHIYNIFYFQVHYMLYWHSFTCIWFHFKNEIPVNCLFTKEKWIYIYIDIKFWTFKLSRSA